MTSENIHLVMDTPDFSFKSSESYFDNKGNIISQPLFETSIRLKKGTCSSFIEKLHESVQKQEPSFLTFYLPTGQETVAEIRGYSISDKFHPIFDFLNILVTLSDVQETILFPNPNDPITFEY